MQDRTVSHMGLNVVIHRSVNLTPWNSPLPQLFKSKQDPQVKVACTVGSDNIHVFKLAPVARLIRRLPCFWKSSMHIY